MELTSASTSWLPDQAAPDSFLSASRVGDADMIPDLGKMLHASKSRSRSMSTASILKVMELLVGYVFVLVLVLKFCQHLRRKASDAGLSRRRLSDSAGNPNADEAEDSSQMSEQCTALERELFVQPSTTGKRQGCLQEEDEGTSQKRRRVVPPDGDGEKAALGLLHSPEAASTFQQRGLRQSSSVELGDDPLPASSILQLSWDWDASQGPPKMPFLKLDEADVSARIDLALAGEVGNAPKSLKELQLEQQSTATAFVRTRTGSAPGPSSAASFQASALTPAPQQLGQVSAESSSAQLYASSAISPTPGPSSGVLPASLGPEHTLGTAESQVDIAALGMFYRGHPFYRTPTIDASVESRHFSVQALDVLNHTSLVVIPRLESIRALLVRPQLEECRVNELLSRTEELVSGAMNSMSGRTSKLTPSKAVRELGLRFLVFDAVLAVHQALGERLLLQRWWARFCDTVETKYKYVDRPQNSRGTRRDGSLAELLSRTLDTYKQQKRPNAAEVVNLKYMLLCSEGGPKYFDDKRFQGWRNDDSEYRSATKRTTDAS